ncbi:MAG: non-canonical purine NTP pyrophosphatase [Bdellovibrio sp. CG12_big_fil_rev_8_21_14_0_65_39_13]|nr:MAG: non-canonical purine NTP pyrophosphatase [Bdellovibrio sp. CG22_combo_CG10-13_8_21_14_all_39_27]PIQ62594.1 MAG: non-canonical purine NTP pyrophosphatase [Bdellovibrio sp. CG12_big_fil_rev_8_21_14_0_65_39_13]PIR36949.1 MAG: non-canonical purine NTP pyrophosphatase [Bdellovibrio sp. CG11_big_fil_rev_8_21_14_0_20_39_38]PJB52375.1 MAG: non-canonical purine NTP pyrophosphatase [Bdellovibrio sp. CG_4_9_14_3_um_filter_39_7]
MEFILASSNGHKAEEFNLLFSGSKLNVVAADLKIEVEETGKSFRENALLKAEAYFKKYKKPTLADDSGLTVHALPDELGIYSARFGGEGLSDKDRALLLLEKMAHVSKADRQAFFTCVLCFYISPEEIYFFEGRMQGAIGDQYVGEHGFGYDPVFIAEKSNDGSLAQSPEYKKEFSHRAQACKESLAFFERGYCQKASNSL